MTPIYSDYDLVFRMARNDIKVHLHGHLAVEIVVVRTRNVNRNWDLMHFSINTMSRIDSHISPLLTCDAERNILATIVYARITNKTIDNSS